MNQLQQNILKTLLYYDIFTYPLKREEIFTYLPTNSVQADDLQRELSSLVREQMVRELQGYYVLRHREDAIVNRRLIMENSAHRLWKIARLMSSIIKRFPFVRAIFVSGDLSKNVSDQESDIDFFVVTSSDRLWIARSFLVLFKKVALLNRRKFFCINYFVTEARLEIQERDLYIASEIVHLKPLYNSQLYSEFMRCNSWVKEYFPHSAETINYVSKVDDRYSVLQKLLELPFLLDSATRLDRWIMEKMETIWKKRYPALSEDDRRRLFRCEPDVSTAHGGDFQTRVLSEYRTRLKAYGLLEE